jgi:prephenate dehydrogenase
MTDVARPLPMAQTGQRPASTALFERVAVIGLGLIGASLAMAVRQAWPTALVIGVDNNEVLEAAIRLHAVDVGADDPVVAAEADLVVLAAPGRENERMLARLPAIIPGEAVVTDVGSAKRTIVAAAAALPGRLAFVGGHPFAGSTRAGIAAARPDLFRGRPWFLTPQSAPGTVVERLRGLVRAVGGEPVSITPAEHDRLLAYLSQMPQVAASAIMQVVGEAVGDEGLGYSGRGLAETTRLAASPASAWTDVYEANSDHVGAAIDALIVVLSSMRDRLDSPEAIAALFAAANQWRARLPRRQEGVEP